MERITGIGGIFFKARDPEKIAAWYRENLGMPVEGGHADFKSHEEDKEIARTVWSLFPVDTDYFGTPGTAFMVNYRVASLDRMLEQLRRNGIAVEKVAAFDYGKFAWITEPEGNRIELWEPGKK